MSSQDLGRVIGSMWYEGTGITGTSTSATVFNGSGVTYAYTTDKYLNTSTGNVYACVTAGDADTAEWVYTGCIKGPQPGLEDSCTSTSTTKALTANQGKVLNDKIDSSGIKPKKVITKCSQTAYTAAITIENKSTTLTLKNPSGDEGTDSYTKAGTAETAVVNVTIGTSIGFSNTGEVIESIASSDAVIYSYILYDNDSTVICSETVALWDHVNDNDENIKEGASITETHAGTTATLKAGAISRLIDSARTALYPITHAKAVWFNKTANKTMNDAVEDIMGSSDVFSPSTAYASGDYVIYGSGLYKFTAAHNGAWTGSDVSKVDLKGLNSNLPYTFSGAVWNQVNAILVTSWSTAQATYTAPSNGFIHGSITTLSDGSGYTTAYVDIGNKLVTSCGGRNSQEITHPIAPFAVRRGDVIGVYPDSNATGTHGVKIDLKFSAI